MKRAVMRGCILVLIVSLLICGTASAIIFDMRYTENSKEDLALLVQVAAEYFDPEEDHDSQAKRFSGAADNIRVTVIALDGTVTGDSAADITTLENHSERVEIKEARGTKTAVSVRSSDTLGMQLMYAVVKRDDGFYIRIAKEYNGFLSNFMTFVPAILLAATLAMFISLIFAGKFSRSISYPIVSLNDSLTGVKDGSTILDPEVYPYVELRDMATKINGLSDDISSHISRLQMEREKISYILDNMSEGFLLLDDQHRILIINNSACAFLGCDKSVVGNNILYATRNMQFIDSLTKAADKASEYTEDLKQEDRYIEARFTVVREKHDEIEGGLIVTLTDVTDSRNAIGMRRDFFSNASHELNTPITSIKGFSELLRAGIPMDGEQQKEIVDRIAMETDRMSKLIGDIITISRLESDNLSYDHESINLEDVVKECCDEVSSLASQNEVVLHTQTEPCVLSAGRKDLRGLVSNLVTNAVKYNIPCGSVDISLKKEGQEIVLTVRNDGEAIPREQQARVFERFYRVDKGRSKEVGGTGLGLSIVKHVTEKLGGSVTLTSNRQAGTCFTVKLPVANKLEMGTESNSKIKAEGEPQTTS